MGTEIPGIRRSGSFRPAWKAKERRGTGRAGTAQEREPEAEEETGRKRAIESAAKKSEGIRREMRLGRGRKTAKHKAIQYYDVERSWPVEWMCKSLEVSRSGYYKWLKHEKTDEEKENEQIAQLVGEYDERFNHTLGYRRMTGYMNRLNQKQYGEKRIYRIMKMMGIRSVIRKKAKKYQYCEPEMVAENILKRDFYAGSPNEKWTTDVTEFKWYEGGKIRKLYLSAILDLYDRSIVSYSISSRNDNLLVFDTFDKAIKANPNAKPIFHSDRGFQYTNKIFQTKLTNQGMTPSASRVGHCIDNGSTEGFWGIVKAEMYYLRRFESKAELITSITDFIQYYNEGRYQARFGFKTPAEVRREALASEKPVQYPIPENKRIQRYKEKYSA
ncbi:MAG TPA: IS3 family transposase [Methanocorpusculum sp.]|nr:IS3 family transposase [Methanocorpusculum sp.]